MQRFLFLILVTSIVLTACDGRKSNKKALSESVEDFNKNNTTSILNYIPESYFERQVDTTLSNGFVVNIITKSNLKDTVVIKQEKNNLKHISNYRTFDVTINITKDNTTIYRKNFKRENILKELANSDTFKSKHLPKDFYKLAILKSKAVGEPPLMYGIGAFFALQNAIKAFNPNYDLDFHAPMTPEKVLMRLYK